MQTFSSWLAAQGGLVGLGVELARFSLLILSVLSVGVIAERLLVLRRIRRAEAAILPALVKQLPQIETDLKAPSVLIARAGIAHLRSQPARIREAVESATTLQIAALQFNLPILATAASTAPYIGLFGTVLGILAAFGEIARSGQTGATIVAGGISEALTATALGLGVAIPAVIAYNYFSGRVNALALQIELNALDIAARLEELAEETAEVEADAQAL